MCPRVTRVPTRTREEASSGRDDQDWEREDAAAVGPNHEDGGNALLAARDGEPLAHFAGTE